MFPKPEHITILSYFQKLSEKLVILGQLLPSPPYFVISRKSTPVCGSSVNTEKQIMEFFFSVFERENISHVFLDSNSQKMPEDT